MDIDGAYLNACLMEMIYMCQPLGFEIPGKEGHICHLQLAIYGLKQASHEWYELFCKTLGNIGLSRCQVEHAVFYRCDKDDYIVMAVNVNDLSIACNTRSAIAKFKQQLHAKFNIKDMSELHWLLGIEVKRDHAAHTITFSQVAYIK